METKHSSPPEIRSSPFTISETVKLSVKPLDPEELRKMDAYWRAANYLSVGQIYLFANPLLREPLKIEHIKPRLLGHWGTTPGLNFIYVHFNRMIKKHDLNVIYIAGPGHGGPGIVANTYLEGTYSEFYPQHSRKTKKACGGCSSSFLFPAAFPATLRPKRPARFMKAANWAIRSRTRMARLSTIPICWFAAWWATAKRKRARWRRVGIRTNF